MLRGTFFSALYGANTATVRPFAPGTKHKAQGTNPVGYDNNTTTPTLGAKLIAPFFLTIGDAENCTLADIKVTGYTLYTMGGVHLNVLDQFGRTIEVPDGSGTDRKIQKAYYWKDGGYIVPGMTAGWYDVDNHMLKDGASVLGDADKIQIKAGDSFYVYGAADHKLQFAGAVNQSQVSYSVKYSDAKAIGNPFAASVKLSEITVTGYEPSFTMGAIHLNELDEFGRTIEVPDGSGTDRKIQKAYYWKDGSYIVPGMTAGWYDVDNHMLKDGASVLGDADKITIEPGKSYWVYGDTGANYMLNISCPIENK